MTKALIQLLSNKAVRTMITEVLVGITVGVVATLKRREINEKRKRFLLCMPKGTRNDGSIRPKEEMRPEDQRNTTGKERQSRDRERNHKRNYMW